MVVRLSSPLSGIDFGYTQESVKWLEGYIERLRISGEFENAETKTKLISVFGSFLGECIVRCYGGTWKIDDDAGVWCVAFNGDNMAFPFAKVQKQIENGLEDGIAGFFSLIPIIFKNIELATPKKP